MRVIYASWFINSVEYGRGIQRKHYPWTKKDRAKFTESDLAEALNLAYQAGYAQAADDAAGVLSEGRKIR